ncbi:MAG: SRPBCC family protein [Pseudomonadota bacterium]
MQFKASEVVTGPVEDVFAYLSDVAYYERTALDTGVEVKRLDKLPRPGPGMRWQIPFRARGRDRIAEVTMVTLHPPQKMRFEGAVQGLHFEIDVQAEALDPNATEVTVATKTRAKSITAKVLLQSMKLARDSLNKGYRQRVRKALRQLEDRLHAGG